MKIPAPTDKGETKTQGGGRKKGILMLVSLLINEGLFDVYEQPLKKMLI